MIVCGLVSSFKEGPMLRAAILSLTALDHVLVCDGPVEGNEGSGGYESEIPDVDPDWLTVVRGTFISDADKRTKMVEWTRRKWPGREVWGLWLDGDEILLWGEYLHDWIWRVSQQGDEQNPVAGWPFALVELDGSVAICMGKLLRVDLVRKYLVSSSYLEMADGSRRTVGNVKYWDIKNGPLFDHWRARPPLQGEPHLQHRPLLRAKIRQVERQHQAEERNYRKVTLDTP